MKKQGTFLGIPYNWNKPSWIRVKETIWNKKSHRLFVPRVFGWGYTINFYELLHKRKKLVVGFLIIVLILGFFGWQQKEKLEEAHKTFSNYYAFRGCTHLIKRTDTYGICKTNTGETIKIVKFHNRWYLDGDLPVCLFKKCE